MSERNVWQGVRVALDELEAADVDPAALGDLLVLYAGIAGRSEEVEGRAFGALVAGGWEPPKLAPLEERDLTATIDAYLARLGRIFTAEAHAYGHDGRLRISAEWVRR